MFEQNVQGGRNRSWSIMVDVVGQKSFGGVRITDYNKEWWLNNCHSSPGISPGGDSYYDVNTCPRPWERHPGIRYIELSMYEDGAGIIPSDWNDCPWDSGFGVCGWDPARKTDHDNVGQRELNSGNICKGRVREVKQKTWRQPRDKEQ